MTIIEIALYFIFLTILPYYISIYKLRRKYDLGCFFIGYYILFAFLFVSSFTEIEQLPSLISSLVIAELTLALVWVELSKRPELELLDFIPILWDFPTATPIRVDQSGGTLSEPSRFLKIREASFPKQSLSKFDKRFSFSVDLSNIGYGEIMVHEYDVNTDDKAKSTTPLSSESNPQERLKLRTQQRRTINISSLDIENTGFYKIRIQVSATTAKRSKEVWFFISEDFDRLKYIEMHSWKLLFSRLIRKRLYVAACMHRIRS